MVIESSKYRKVTLSLRPEDYEVLRFVAFKRKVSVAGVVREMIQEVLEDEEEHIDWIETQLDQIEQMGLPVYLGEQLED